MFKIEWDKLLQISIVLSIAFLMYNGIDGWGWLVFLLLISITD